MRRSVFGQSRINYLGHWVLKRGVEVDGDKVKAMVNWPSPKNVMELQGFLGLTGYYRRFVQNYGTVVAPLTQLLQKEGFRWSSEGTKAFEALKKAMVTLSILALPNFEQPFVVETDASGSGLGTVLIQDKQPIAYFSRAL